MIDPREIAIYAKNTGRLKLSLADTLQYYRFEFLFAALFLDILFVIVLKGYFIDGIALVVTNIVAIIAFLITFAVRRKTLKFTVIQTKLPKERVLSLLKEVIADYGWEIEFLSPDIIIVDNIKVLDRNFDPPLDVQKFVGERITIVFDHNKVYVNSILNMHKLSGWRGCSNRQSNLENVYIIRKEILMEEE